MTENAKKMVLNEYCRLCSMHFRNISLLNQVYLNEKGSLRAVQSCISDDMEFLNQQKWMVYYLGNLFRGTHDEPTIGILTNSEIEYSIPKTISSKYMDAIRLKKNVSQDMFDRTDLLTNILLESARYILIQETKDKIDLSNSFTKIKDSGRRNTQSRKTEIIALFPNFEKNITKLM